MVSYIYEITETKNGSVNLEKLSLEIRASVLNGFVIPPYMFKNKIYCDFEYEITDTEKVVLKEIIGNHDGAKTQVSDSEVQIRRRKKLDLVEMARNHPLLDELDMLKYLEDMYVSFSVWVDTGNSTLIQAKIFTDAMSGTHPQDVFLNTVVNTEGNKTFEYLIGTIIS